MFANVFVDFGEQFEVIDTDGENPLQAMVSSITQEKPATVWPPSPPPFGKPRAE